MASVADQVSGISVPAAADAPARAPAAAVASSSITLPAVGERELRLDLFRGLALWLIFIDHLPTSLLTWLTLRNYGFSDATEIFIFISGYTAAFVYGRALLEQGFVVSAARILRRAWQIYVAHVFLFTIFLAEISYVATHFENPLYSEEMGIMDFLKQPDVTIVQALLLRFRPVNMDVLPLYIVLMLALPLILVSMRWRADLTLALSVLLYAATWEFDLYFSSYPSGVWMFNPLAWQLLFVFGAWCALGGARRMSRILSSNITLWVSIVYLIFAFFVTLTWYVPQLGHVLPRRLEQWMYPIDKTDLDVLRFAHFLALAAITVRFLPNDWPGLKSPWLKPLMLCGQHSLEIFCLGVFLAFAGHFILAEVAGGAALHALISLCGIVIMSSVAWLISWYKHSADKSARKGARGNADLAGGG
ncbi:OpgC domain-containing protein [Bradyrhizobium sp. Tv2a-2]|uniref:OpgC domain-containing protein n=1 Tax=Bradyrhizobium sp. Tv2a-2 TaxID=113395 RepID=UPI0004042F53|nr:OpgC domain-containing protein [Bradyrhizobium sp. Tv2a-2]